MNLELKNDTLLVIFEKFAEEIRNKDEESLIILTDAVGDEGAQLDDTRNEVSIGTIVALGDGRLTKYNTRQMPPELKEGTRIMYKTMEQISYADEGKTFVLIGVGNVLGIVDDKELN